MVDRYAVIGNPIAHSKSPLIHGLFAQAEQQALEYTTLLAPLDGFAEAVRAFRDGGGRGMNVTAPFKMEAFEIADEVSAGARLAGAVNALKFEGGRILAENFDGIGLVNDIARIRGGSLVGRRILILGAGGAVHGALMPLLAEGPAELVIANRHAEKAQALAAACSGKATVRGGAYEDIGDDGFDIVINGTSASQRGEALPLHASVFGRDCLAYELVYGKGLTPFLRQAQAAGARQLADGVGMLVEQAAEAFAWWRGMRPDTQAVIERLTIPLV